MSNKVDEIVAALKGGLKCCVCGEYFIYIHSMHHKLKIRSFEHLCNECIDSIYMQEGKRYIMHQSQKLQRLKSESWLMIYKHQGIRGVFDHWMKIRTYKKFIDSIRKNDGSV